MSFLNNKKIFPVPFKKHNSLYFYLPYFLLVSWIALTIISIFFVGLKNLTNGFVIFSIIIRLLLAAASVFFFKIIFLDRNKERKIYTYFKSYIGYGIILTYVFFSLPRMVGEFGQNISFGFQVFSFVSVIFITLFPTALYLLLLYSKTKIALEFFKKKDIEFEKKIKKDKKLKKREQKRIKSERNFFENLWYEWIDVIIQAIIIALIIQQFAFQMYQIPSESMVPTFLIKDRVMANKVIYGPHIPLTEWKLPSLFKPKIGDIVVFKNPEMDYPDSDVRYENVITRIFHPFVYMLTLSLVDIDKYKNGPKAGSPKERLLVKRLIAEEGEKICMVNDMVYKKTKEDTEWKKMSDIPGQTEYGRVNLFYNENPKMKNQMMTPYYRNILNNSQKVIEDMDIIELENMYEKEITSLINNIKRKKVKKEKFYDFYNSYINYNYFSEQQYYINPTTHPDTIGKRFEETLLRNGQFNKGYYSKSDVENLEKMLISEFDNYNFPVFLESILEYADFLDYLISNNYDSDNLLNYKIIDKENESPYKKYIKKLNLITKIYKVKVFQIINNKFEKIKNIYYEDVNKYSFEEFKSIFTENEYEDIHNLYLLHIYMRLFYFRNFPDFPVKSDEYIKKDEYFMVGDNRYNSHDNRYNGRINITDYNGPIDDEDTTYLAIKHTDDSWKPRTISNKHVLGKAWIIYWPMERFRVFR